MANHETQLDKELGALKKNLIHMAMVVEQMIDQAITQLINRNEEFTAELVREEQEINRLQIHIDELALTILATLQPVAADLRLILAATKINSDLERIGDLVVNITENVRVLVQQPPLKPLIDIPRMAELVRRMVRESVESFIAGDIDLARRVILTDDKVDALKDQVLRELLTYMTADHSTIERAMALVLISRHLERIGDHANNIAEDVIYAVCGQDVRHPLTQREGHEE